MIEKKDKLLLVLEENDFHLGHKFIMLPYNDIFYGEKQPLVQSFPLDQGRTLYNELVWIKNTDLILLGNINHDPYQILEEKYRQTRAILDAILIHKFPVHIITKSFRILEDIEILKKLSKESWVHVSVSFSTFDIKFSKLLEPDFSYPDERLKIISTLKDSGISIGIIYNVFPLINSSEEDIDNIFNVARKYGVNHVIDEILHLEEDVKEQFFLFMDSNPKLRKYLNRYKRLYSHGASPQLKNVKDINRIFYDCSLKYNISRKLPDYNIGKKKK
jgi:DNA repair photolyase